MDWTYNDKISTGNWNTYLAEHYRVGGREFVEMQLLTRVFGLWRGRLVNNAYYLKETENYCVGSA